MATFSGAISGARQAGKPVGELVIVAKAGRIPYDAWCVRSDLPRRTKDMLRQALLSTNTINSLGRKVLAPTLGINGWVAADDSIYDKLREVESTVSKTIGNIPATRLRSEQ